jgi:cytidyltransferase-like protein
MSERHIQFSPDDYGLLVPHTEETTLPRKLERHIPRPLETKIITLDQLAEVRALNPDLVIGYAMGSFDLMHAGHVRALYESHEHCDILVVGVNSNESVAERKPGRPIIDQSDRIEQVAACEAVDYAFIFPQKTATEGIRLLQPNIVCISEEQIQDPNKYWNELEEAAKIGSIIDVIPRDKPVSTTHLVGHIRNHKPNS